MPKPKRHLQATAEETSTPPNSLKEGEVLAQVIKGEGKNLYVVELPESKKLLVELPSRFRSTIWMKRGSVVLVNTMAFEDRENKLGGEIINIVRDEKIWRKQSYWPPTFIRKTAYPNDSGDEESTVGKIPPSEGSGSED
ncbi:hypothetical protein MMC06_002305 [Schaereria dolodes]|nr:hypothetical protein [Schaereria dolodes]